MHLNSGVFMNTFKVVLLGLSLSVLMACSNDLMVPNFNEPSVDDLQTNPTRVNIAAAAQGLLRVSRQNQAEAVQWLGAFGREGYPMSQTGASTTGSVRDRLNGGSFVGGTMWTGPYRNIRNVNLLLAAVEATEVLTPEEKAAVRGFARTIQGYEFFMIGMTRWNFGAPIAVDVDPAGEPAPFVSRAEVMDHVTTLLDDGAAELASGGDAFPFSLTSGLSDFDSPSAFRQLNRAIRARVAIHLDDWGGALSALDESFLDPGLPLSRGAYHVFGTGSGDAANPLNRPDFLYAHTRIRDGAQLRGDGSPDLRVQTKITQVPTFTVSGITSDVQFTMYSSPTAPLPWVKNEELILLRAEANLGLMNYADARDDINFIRENSGGLEHISTLDPDLLLDELLYNKRYSLVWEGGHVWFDLRHYDRLLEIPTTSADPMIHETMPIPSNDCFSRNPEPAGCGEIPPLSGG